MFDLQAFQSVMDESIITQIHSPKAQQPMPQAIPDLCFSKVAQCKCILDQIKIAHGSIGDPIPSLTQNRAAHPATYHTQHRCAMYVCRHVTERGFGTQTDSRRDFNNGFDSKKAARQSLTPNLTPTRSVLSPTAVLPSLFFPRHQCCPLFSQKHYQGWVLSVEIPAIVHERQINDNLLLLKPSLDSLIVNSRSSSQNGGARRHSTSRTCDTHLSHGCRV